MGYGVGTSENGDYHPLRPRPHSSPLSTTRKIKCRFVVNPSDATSDFGNSRKQAAQNRASERYGGQAQMSKMERK